MSSKLIFDNIHQYMEISPIAKVIIDTKYFQRLRNISQLGTCKYVFPAGNHSRFEHSLGVYHLTGKMLENIRKNSNVEEMNIEIDGFGKIHLNNRIIELVKIGGLCHDLGHGPFSHVFDDLILIDLNNENKYHEIRSCKILEIIIKEFVNKNKDIIDKGMIIEDSELKFIQDIINPSENQQNFIYQIVSNNVNSIDVDKFDYIARDTNNVGLKNGFDYSRMLEDVKVIDNKICYPKQTYLHLCNLFTTRYYLHKQIYNHKTVKSIEYMLYDIIKLLEPVLNIKKSVLDLEKFIVFTDDFFNVYLDLWKLKNVYVVESLWDSVDKACELMERIKARELYKFVGDFTVSKTKNNIINYKDFYEICPEIDYDDLIISVVKLGFISGNKENPLDNIYLYDKKNGNECFKIKKEEVTNFLPEIYQEICIKIFCKNMNKFEIIKNTFNTILEQIN